MTKNNWQEMIGREIDPVVNETERLIVEFTEFIAKMMDNEGVSRTDLASRIEATPAFVTKLLSGDNNFTFATVAKLSVALGLSPHMHFTRLGVDGVCRVPMLCEPPVITDMIDAPYWKGLLGNWHDIGSVADTLSCVTTPVENDHEDDDDTQFAVAA